MRRIIVIAAAGLSLAGCSSFSLDSFKSAPPPMQVQLDSAPPGADASALSTLRAFSPVACLAEAQQPVPPLFIARAGRDAMPLLNNGLDRFVASALAANVPLTLLNHPAGVHGFDSQNDDDRSREILRAAIAFARSHLT